MTDAEVLVKDFFERYTEAKKCYLCCGQLFHENAEEAANLRGAFYGQAIETFENPKIKAANLTAVLNSKNAEQRAASAKTAAIT
jgi:hypothetical protein